MFELQIDHDLIIEGMEVIIFGHWDYRGNKYFSFPMKAFMMFVQEGGEVPWMLEGVLNE